MEMKEDTTLGKALLKIGPYLVVAVVLLAMWTALMGGASDPFYR